MKEHLVNSPNQQGNMKIIVENDSVQLGKRASGIIVEKLNESICRKGTARLLLSTGASQFNTLKFLVKEKVDWQKVTMFHLDEYIGLDESHKASFCKYLKERFGVFIPLGRAVYISGIDDMEKTIAGLNREINEDYIDIGVIGIGENAHIAFNDPPADFNTDEPYIVVDLDEKCKQQQVREGWFETVDDVPKQAITISPKQIMKCKSIVSPVPGAVKAEAIRNMLQSGKPDKNIPATILKQHPDFRLVLDKDSASLCDLELLK